MGNFAKKKTLCILAKNSLLAALHSCQTDGRTYGHTDGHTDKQTDLLKEKKGHTYSRQTDLLSLLYLYSI